MIEGLFNRRKKGRRVLDEVRRFDTLVGGRTRLQGTLEGLDNCIVNGSARGDCRLRGVLVVGEGASWKGNIQAVHAVISGSVEGDIQVEQKLELAATAHVRGTLSGPAIAIARGAVHEGEIRMEGRSEIVRFEERRKPAGT